MSDEITPVSSDMDALTHPALEEEQVLEGTEASTAYVQYEANYTDQEAALENAGAPPPTLWQRIRVLLFGRIGSIEEATARLWNLTQAIESGPDSATNYVLRGELYLSLGDIETAQQDFAHALELASAQLETEQWGLLAQAAQDRAEKGLARTKRIQHQRKSNSGN